MNKSALFKTHFKQIIRILILFDKKNRFRNRFWDQGYEPYNTLEHLLIRKLLKPRMGKGIIQKKDILSYTLCDPAGTRTQDPYIKSVLLYQLSYGIEPFPAKKKHQPFFFGSAKIGELENQPNIYKYILA